MKELRNPDKNGASYELFYKDGQTPFLSYKTELWHSFIRLTTFEEVEIILDNPIGSGSVYREASVPKKEITIVHSECFSYNIIEKIQLSSAYFKSEEDIGKATMEQLKNKEYMIHLMFKNDKGRLVARTKDSYHIDRMFLIISANLGK